MFSRIRRILGAIEVKEINSQITISGIPADVMTNDIARIWKTTRINANMFTRATRDSLSFPSFFAVDVLYMLEHMIEHGNPRVRSRTLAKIRDELIENTWLVNTQQEHKPRVNLSLIKNLIYTPLDYQQKFFDNYDRLTQQYCLDGFLLAAAAGAGKAQPLDAKIKIPGGWSTMGEMSVGTTVTAWDGTPTKVTGVYPQGKKRIFEISFKDGRTTRACEDHLWRIYDRACYRNKENGWKVVTTIELISLLSKKNSMIYVPLAKSEQSDPVDLPIDPYLMGVLLGDGNMSQGYVTITKGDEELFTLVEETLPDNLRLVERNSITRGVIAKKGMENTLLKVLRDYDLMGKISIGKFVPDVYLSGSHEQRQSLLQGLMDTDGFIDTHGSCSFSTSSYRLATQVQELVWSLGGIAKLSHRVPYYTYNGVRKAGQVTYRVHMRFIKPSEIFRLTRKKDRTNDEHQYAKNLKLRVTGIQFVGYELAQCISIDHPDRLYVTDNHVVTHNTYISMALAEMLEADLVVVVCPKNATERVWESEIKKLFKTPQTYWIYQQGKKWDNQRFAVFHYEALKEALAMAKANKFNGKKTFVILDESHNLNEETSQRTQQFIELCRQLRPSDVLPMSGTPIKALGAESIPLMLMIDPLFNEEARVRYKKIYGRDGKRAVDILNHRMGLVSYKVEKHQLGLDKPIMKKLPIKIPNGNDYTLTAIRKDMSDFIDGRFKYYKERQERDYDIYFNCLKIYEASIKTPLQRSEFDTYQKYVKMIRAAKGDARQVGEEIKWSNSYEKNVITPTLPKNMVHLFKDVKSIYKYVNLKIQGEALGRVLGRKRIDCHVDMVPHIDFKGIAESTTKKTVVFTSFVDALEMADKHIATIGMNPITVYGKTNSELANSVRLFERNEDVNPLCATYQSLSTAVPLVMADTMIMIDAPFRAYIHEQAISRIHRLGATTQTIIWECQLDTGNEPNISTRSSDILAWSQDQVQAIMGMESPFKVEEGNDNLRVSTEEFDIHLDYDWTPESIAFEDYSVNDEPSYLNW